jgi:hypothetical protein
MDDNDRDYLMSLAGRIDWKVSEIADLMNEACDFVEEYEDSLLPAFVQFEGNIWETKLTVLLKLLLDGRAKKAAEQKLVTFPGLRVVHSNG